MVGGSSSPLNGLLDPDASLHHRHGESYNLGTSLGLSLLTRDCAFSPLGWQRLRATTSAPNLCAEAFIRACSVARLTSEQGNGRE